MNEELILLPAVRALCDVSNSKQTPGFYFTLSAASVPFNSESFAANRVIVSLLEKRQCKVLNIVKPSLSHHRLIKPFPHSMKLGVKTDICLKLWVLQRD